MGKGVGEGRRGKVFRLSARWELDWPTSRGNDTEDGKLGNCYDRIRKPKIPTFK